MRRRRAALQSTPGPVGKVLSLGGQIQLIKRTGGVPPLGLCQSITRHQAHRHASWWSKRDNQVLLFVFWKLMHLFVSSSWCRQSTTLVLRRLVSLSFTEATLSPSSTDQTPTGGRARSAPERASSPPPMLLPIEFNQQWKWNSNSKIYIYIKRRLKCVSKWRRPAQPMITLTFEWSQQTHLCSLSLTTFFYANLNQCNSTFLSSLFSHLIFSSFLLATTAASPLFHLLFWTFSFAFLFI